LIKLATDGSVLARYSVGNGANGLTVGGDGNLWVSLNNERNVARVTTAGVVTKFATPGQPYAITTGPSGNVWFGNGVGANNIWRMAMDGQVTATFPTSDVAESMTRGPSGNIWFTADGTTKYVARLTTAGSLTTYSAGLAAGASPQGITAGPDGNVWFVTKGQAHVYRVLTGTVPTNTIAPTLSGKTAIGSTLTADPGGWQYQPTSYAYRWERCTSAAGTGCTVISGKTASTYTTTAADSGAYIRVGVTATNTNGESARVYSATLTEDRLPDNSGGSSTSSTNATAGPIGPTVGPTLLGNETIRSIVGTSTRITTTVKVTAAGHLAQTSRAGNLVVCRASTNPTKASTVKLVCHLSARAKAILNQRALRISVTTTFTPTGFPTAAVTRMIKIPRTAGSSEPVVG
jgi:streptogramin lyase